MGNIPDGGKLNEKLGHELSKIGLTN